MSINIERTPIHRALSGKVFDTVYAAPDGSTVAFMDSASDIPMVFEAQNAQIVEICHAGVYDYVLGDEKVPDTQKTITPFPWFEVAGARTAVQYLPYLGGKLVTFTLDEASDCDSPSFGPVQIILYTPDKDAEVDLVLAFCTEEGELFAKCQKVQTMKYVAPYKLGKQELDVQGLVDKDEDFALSLEDGDGAPEFGQCMNLGDILAGTWRTKAKKASNGTPTPCG